jgi:diacylglycerol kinase family enzyme
VRFLLIANPFATNVDDDGIRAVQEVLEPERTMLTEGPGHATELAASPGDVDAIAVFGGDGLVNEALNGLGDLPFAALPGGGTSVFARALGLPRDPVEAARRVREGTTRRISLGRVNGRRFGFNAGLGLDAELVRRVDALGRAADGRRPGDFAFTYEFLRLLAAHRFKLEPSIDVHGLGRAAAVLVTNGDPYTYAGALPLHLSPQAEFELGLDIVAPVRVSIGVLPRLARALLARKRRESGYVLYAHDVDHVEVTCDRPLPLQADGEDLGDVEHAVFTAEREAVTVLV